MDFVRGDGRPIRFWGGSDYNLARPELRGTGSPRPIPRHTRREYRAWHGHLPPPCRNAPATARRSRPCAVRHQREGTRRGLQAGRGHEEGRHLHDPLAVLGLAHRRAAQLGHGRQRQPLGPGVLRSDAAGSLQELGEALRHSNPYGGVPLKDDRPWPSSRSRTKTACCSAPCSASQAKP